MVKSDGTGRGRAVSKLIFSDNAYHYAEMGLKIAPVAPGEKHPCIADWPNQATHDLTTAQSWASTFPTHNIGAVTGPYLDGYLIVIDVEPLQRHELEVEGDDTEAAAAAILKALNAAKVELYKAFDYLFDANVAEAFFAKVNPFTLTGGRFFCEVVLEAVGGFISQRIGTEVNKLNTRVQKYTHGYRTGKHKNGKK